MTTDTYSFRNTYAFESITVGVTAKQLTAATFENSQEALITVASNIVRWRTDGTDPTSGVGHVMTTDQSILIKGGTDISRFRVISQTGADAILSISYYK